MTNIVSIIIPTHNRAHIISKTLDSIRSQTYKNWECIIVDDYSTDETVEVILNYIKIDNRFKFFTRPNRLPKGANGCRNYGLTKAKGVYINWFDSDDLMMPLKLELQVKQLTNSELNYTICQTERIDVLENKSLGLRSEKLISNDILNDYINFKIFWMTGAPLWRKDFLITNNLTFDPELQQSQDYDYHINVLAKDSKYEIITDVLMQLLKHEENMSNNLYDSPSKTYSNIRTRQKALSNHIELLQVDTRLFLFRKILEYYKNGIPTLNWRFTVKSYLALLKSYKCLNLNGSKLTFPIFKWFLGSLSYRIFGKGERFFKSIYL